ncbi:MAG: hypothetical protein ABEJ55_07055 [Halanaeroarchaeum sp.]
MTMVEREITDGPRIATVLKAEIRGLQEPPFDALAVENENADADTEPPDNRAFEVDRDDETLASVHLQADRVALEFRTGLEPARERAEVHGLRTRPKASSLPKLLVFVENAAAVKRAVDVIGAAAD